MKKVFSSWLAEKMIIGKIRSGVELTFDDKAKGIPYTQVTNYQLPARGDFSTPAGEK